MPRTDTPTPITNASIVRGFEALSVTKDEEEWVRALVARRLERDRAGLETALRRLLAICDDEFDPNRCPEMAEARQALRAAKGEA